MMKSAYPFVNCCLFRIGPADIPASRRLLFITLLSYLVLNTVANSLDNNWTASLMLSLGDSVLMMASIAVLLKFRSLPSRYLQTLTAMAGMGCFFMIISFPFLWWFYQLELETASTSPVTFFIAILSFWNLMVIAHIFKQSLEIQTWVAASLSVVMVVISLVVMGLIMSGVA